MPRNKRVGGIKLLPIGSLEFLIRFKDSRSWDSVTPYAKSMITRAINKELILNKKQLNAINKTLKKLKGVNNILDKSNPRLKYTGKYKSKPKKTYTGNPFNIHWEIPKGNTSKENWTIYTRSSIWKNKRNYILDKRGAKCQDPDCDHPVRSRAKLHCHHLTYVRFGRENENDLQILCANCHNKAHKRQTIKEMQEDFKNSNWVEGVKM